MQSLAVAVAVQAQAGQRQVGRKQIALLLLADQTLK